MSSTNSRKRRRDSSGHPRNSSNNSPKKSRSSSVTATNSTQANNSQHSGNLRQPNTNKNPSASPSKSPNPDKQNTQNDICLLTQSEIELAINCNCPVFTSYLLHTNGQSLYNILLLEYNLKFEHIQCCHSNCAANNHEHGDFYICLHCVYYCCSDTPSHLLAHCQQQKHFLYFELSTQQIYCCKCGKYHQSPWTDLMILQYMEMANKRLSSIKSSSEQIQSTEVEIVDNAESIWKRFDCIRDNGKLGIRGALNLGNTCYMTAILQVFMHNAFLRNYFLSCSHSSICQRSTCVSCELERVFYDFYCGVNNSAVSILSFIGCIWRDTTYNLAGNEMHDSHEFFISLNTLIHKTTPSKYKCNDDEKQCKCIVHSTFRGLWLSELKCSKCSHVSPKIDTFMEINLQPRKLKMKLTSKSNLDQINNKTIMEALADYMESEPMPDYKCSNCSQRNTCHKAVSIHSLPQTLCLHLKRFESDELLKEISASAIQDNGNNETSHHLSASAHDKSKLLSRSLSPSDTITKKTRSRRKSRYQYEYQAASQEESASNDSHARNVQSLSALHDSNNNNNGNGNKEYVKNIQFLQFPVDELLDLSQFINPVHKEAKVNNKKYRLTSMIVHTGVLSSGHYISCIRKENQWYYCDDNRIYPSLADNVKTLNAYMLFYEAQ